jgi:transposase
MHSAADLPDDIEALKQLIVTREAELAAAKAGLIAKTLEAEKLKFELARLKRMSFGQSSERIAQEIAQLELRLEEIETAAADTEPQPPTADLSASEAPSNKPRRALPEHLPRVTQVYEPVSCTCPRCGSDRMRKVGEDITEILEYVPSRFEVVRHVRPALSCAKCEAMGQAPMPALPIPRGMAGASTIAHVVMAKYADHLPLYRQSATYAREGVELDRALLAGWVGKAAWLVRPLVERIGAHVMVGDVIHADDTPVPVLAPGNGKTRTGRLWVYLRDERPHAGTMPAAVLYRDTPDRKGERCRAHLSTFSGHLHADGYAGFAELYESRGGIPALVTEVACWAQVLRPEQGQRLTGRQGGTRQDRRAVRHRAPDRRQATR